MLIYSEQLLFLGKFKVWRNGSLEGAENFGYLSVLRPARQSSSSYGAPAAPEENCYVETPCTRSCGDGFKAGGSQRDILYSISVWYDISRAKMSQMTYTQPCKQKKKTSWDIPTFHGLFFNFFFNKNS